MLQISFSSTPMSRPLTTYCLLDKEKFLTPLFDHQMCPLSNFKTIYLIFSFYFHTPCDFHTRLFSFTKYPGLSFLYAILHGFLIFWIPMISILSPCHQTPPGAFSYLLNKCNLYLPGASTKHIWQLSIHQHTLFYFIHDHVSLVSPIKI